MPEGDTIFRTAVTLGRWLVGREVTAARTDVVGLPAAKLVGQRVEEVEPRGKHLLIRFSAGQVLHTHMRMTGSWHVYGAGEPWRKPAGQARLVLEAGDRTAVCFNAPVVELLAPKGEAMHPALTRLGPDVLVDPLDLDEVVRRAATRPPGTSIGELLLDQQVVAGIGNIYRSEALFLARLHPRTPMAEVDEDRLRSVVTIAARLMRANARPGEYAGREFGGGPDEPWVYGRTGRPCRRCRGTVEAVRLGEQARVAYWCPRCQPAPPPPARPGPDPA